ncbi:TetR family transcriptional regulator [Pueribacillus theae]|uniref:TetR family transcriptional regulator n=1 Tax=Pueribacillus theae TaxID=2171751 RepID=A0A2U1K553_9BACI|nr:TetR/AcrR family transcriptional regulator [Pueribacillus theae]PWA12299.1 TetR family transcriptional regulator [Pueribacillus theae]
MSRLGKSRGPKYGQIIDAAVEVIAENGFHQAQVSKIAKKAKVADGTIYLYFKNKEDILISVFREKMGLFVSCIEEAMGDKETVEDKLLALIETYFKNLSENYHWAIVTQLELRQTDKRLRGKIGEILKDLLILLDTIIDEGKLQGVFKQEMDKRIARQMIFGTIDETVTTWVMKDRKYDLVSLAAPIHHLLLSGLLKDSKTR